MKLMVTSFGDTGSRRRAGARALLEVLVTVALLASVPGAVLAAPAFTAKASVSPLIQYLNDTTGTTFTLTIDNTGDVSIGAVEITRPTSLWTVIACPAAPVGWTTQRADTKCRYRSANTSADDIPGHTSSSSFQLTATTAPGTQNVTGTWTVVVSRTNQFDDKSKLKTAAPESPGLATTAYTFQILDAVVVASALTPGSACPAPTAANHSAGSGTTQTIAICGKNRASLALTPVAPPSTLGGTYTTGGTFGSASIAANSASSIVLGNWSNTTVNTPSGTGKSIIARIGSAANRTSPSTTLDDSCPTTQTADNTCINNGGYEAIDDAPTVTSTSPATGANHVAVNANIVVNFSESVNATTSSFTLECPTGTAKSFTVSGSPGLSITLDPTADLPEGTTCSVKVVANQIHDTDLQDPPDTMTADYNFSFTTDSAPTVTSTSPADSATGVATSSNVTVNFSEQVTATASSFTLECPSATSKAFTVSGSGTSTITLDPTADLPATTVCMVTVLAAGISDVDTGDPPDNLAANYVFSFTTVDAAPTVTSTSPANNADHVAVNTNIVVNFSEPVTATTSSFTLECPTSTAKTFAVSGSGTSSITLDPTADLPEGTVCSVKVIANQIFDVDSVDPPDNMAADYNFSFITDSAPAVTTTTPADNATGVTPAANITVNFSEPVDVTTTSFTISCDSNPQTFTVSGTGTTSITLDPTSDLPGTSSCTVTAVALNISDTDAGDPPDHPAANFVFSFTTEDAAPTVATTNPADLATGVSSGTNIVINFSESVSATSNAFSLDCPSGTPKTFSQSSSPATTVTLTPNANLPQNTTCTVTVHKDEISDTDLVDPPDHMAADYVFSFTTAADQAPTDIALSHQSMDENQPSGTTVGTLTTTDLDSGDTFTYSLENAGCGGGPFSDNGSFSIGGVGSDELKSAASFDFETKSSYTICVRSTDSGSLSFDKQFTISINDVNEAPTNISLSNSSIDENQPSNTTIGALTATDPDTGQTHTFTLQNSGCSGSFPDNASFTISGGDLKSAVSFNYEVKNSYTICVRTTDNGTPNLSFDKQFTITINDVNDAPVAVADSYSGAIGNTLAVNGTPGSEPRVILNGNVLTSNDTDEDVTFPHTLSALAETNISTGGGTATINSNGSFTFLPGVGDKNQSDTFTYHVTDGTAMSAGTVTVHIDDFLVWYVDNALGANGDGRSNSPYNTLASLQGADLDGPGDYIFLYQGSGPYAGGLPLEASQKLFGEKHGLTINGITLVSPGATTPVVTNAAGVGVGLASGVDVQGINISGTSGDGINGVAVTTATVGTVTPVFISSYGGDGVHLSGSASGNISIAAPIMGSAGHSVSVANRSGGTTVFSGAIFDSGTGIQLQSNTGATINLAGDVTASTGANTALSATGGGTLNATGSFNTLATTTGTALNVANTTIGASGLNFQSIASNGATSGIVLNTTGSSGGLTVSGNGSAGSGGTIQNSSDSGILATSTKTPSLSWMNISNNGNAVNEGGVRMTDVTGTGSITSSTVTGGFEDNVYIKNDTTTATFTVQGPSCSITNNSSVSGNNGINILAATSANLTATVDGCSFSGNRAVTIGADSADNSTLNVTITNNTITQGSPNHGNQGIQVSGAANGNVTFLVDHNKVGTPDGTTASPLENTGINIFNGTAGNAVMAGRVSNNTVLNDPTFAVGVSNGFGIRVFNSNLAQIRAKVLNNTVKNVNTDYGILAESSGTASAPTAPHGRLDVEISSNNVNVNAGALDAIRAQARNFNTLCGKIASNTTLGGGVGFFGIFIRQANSAIFDLDGWNGVGLPEAYVLTQNPSATTTGSAGTITGVAANTCNFTGVP